MEPQIHPIILYLLRELFKIAWLLVVALVFAFIYLLLVIIKQRKNHKLLVNKLGYLMPEIKNPILGHINEHTSLENQVNWHKRFGKIYGFFNCDKAHLRVADLDFINEVFLKQSRIFAARTWNEYRLTPFNSGILFSWSAPWRKARRLMYPSMSMFRMTADQHENHLVNTELLQGITRLIKHFHQLVSPVQVKLSDQDDEKAASEYASEINNKGFARVQDTHSPTGWSVDMRAHGVMELIALDIIMRVALDVDDVDVLKGTSEPLINTIDGWLRNLDDPWAKWAQALPLARALMPFVLVFNSTFHSYWNFMFALLKRHNSILDRQVRKDQDHTIPVSLSAAAAATGRSCRLLSIDPAASGSGDDTSGYIRPKSIFQSLVEEYRAGRMRKREVIGHAGATIVAGFETTATTSAFILWNIARYPKLKTKLLTDVLEYDIQSRYLDMFIKEVLRMYPPLTNFVVRTPIKDALVLGRKIPRGMSVYLGVHTVHYDETIYPQPYQFDPERFAEGKTYPPGAYVPFGLGNRMCVGYHLAMREMKIITVELLKNFDIQLISPQLELERESLTIFLTRAKHDIRVRLIPRKLPSPTPTPTMTPEDKLNGNDGNGEDDDDKLTDKMSQFMSTDKGGDLKRTE